MDGSRLRFPPDNSRRVNPACELCQVAVSVHGDDSQMCVECHWLNHGHVIRRECRNCRTASLECHGMYNTKCDRCSLRGIDCVSEASPRRCQKCATAKAKARGIGWVSVPSLAGEGESLSSSSPTVQDRRVVDVGGKEPEPGPQPQPGRAGRSRLHTYCSGCGDIFSQCLGTGQLEEQCYRCEVGKESGKEGQVMVLRTCISCFEPKLDPGSLASFCAPCEASRATIRTTKNTSQSSGCRGPKSGWDSAGRVENIMHMDPFMSISELVEALRHNAEPLRKLFPSVSVSVSQMALLLSKNNLEEAADYLTRTGYDTRPSTRCGVDERGCDDALPPCAACRETKGLACSYMDRDATNMQSSDSDAKQFCSRNRDTGIQDQDEDNQSSVTGALKPHRNTSSSTSTSTSTSSHSQRHSSFSQKASGSSSEVPRFLEFVNTRLEDLRLGRQPSAIMPSFPPTLLGAAFSVRPPSPCLACLDQQTACAFHPRPVDYGVFSSMVAALAIQDRDPTLAIPCLACFDGETTCAHHEQPEESEKTERALKTARSCGSCRLARLACDGARKGCLNCQARGLDCMYISGGALPLSEADILDPGVLPAQEDSDVPQPPRACGGCRMVSITCDALRPGCTTCKEKGLDCMYIGGATPPSFSEPVFATLLGGEKATGNGGVADDIALQLDDSVTIAPPSKQSGVNASQLDDSIILAAAHVGGDLDVIDDGESQMDELESEDWEVVSRNEDYEVVEATKKKKGEESRGTFRFW
ncbi:uncharacterized protein L3040_006201 [Drepanopeziza brunnea f. sp. 'multigermtubi']|uniref:Zn(2)-C6 fungal-type domain-containing protein n=1 Tax=Marssonina brunnea f. sp. multigermtubi (strain MB_m1) TaxID=1072389 RepID=K1WUR7_MARBU|nr:uncharacterized protein MBM_00533 [Drepanopeziza brunnea f. sp. 'multigermtubi' MB_m1]EKD21420.1 hypothetical protein MBM_00533 [Drepanopeziza brunnea f. sp. 'multigermtubi' MB_m1]KAJ5040548.1 hypothetical protein L3040_006201 [Drepanopeziza brunnea f. sp. 'multigermtubi']